VIDTGAGIAWMIRTAAGIASVIDP